MGQMTVRCKVSASTAARLDDIARTHWGTEVPTAVSAAAVLQWSAAKYKCGSATPAPDEKRVTYVVQVSKALGDKVKAVGKRCFEDTFVRFATLCEILLAWGALRFK